jgi:hypothetical protein
MAISFLRESWIYSVGIIASGVASFASAAIATSRFQSGEDIS